MHGWKTCVRRVLEGADTISSLPHVDALQVSFQYKIDKGDKYFSHTYELKVNRHAFHFTHDLRRTEGVARRCWRQMEYACRYRFSKLAELLDVPAAVLHLKFSAAII